MFGMKPALKIEAIIYYLLTITDINVCLLFFPTLVGDSSTVWH